MLRAICASRLAVFWSVSFVVLIVLPTTAPFQSVSFRELLGCRTHRGVESAPNVSFGDAVRGTAVSTIPASENSEGRLRGASQAIDPRADATSPRWTALPVPAVVIEAGPSQRPAVLRL